MERLGSLQGGDYLVEIAFFKTAREAVQTLTELMGQGYDGSVLSRKVGDEVVHFVQLGPYATEDDAARVAREVGAETGATTRVVVQP